MFHGPDAPVLQQDVLAALTASGIEFWLKQGFTRVFALQVPMATAKLDLPRLDPPVLNPSQDQSSGSRLHVGSLFT